MADEGSGGPSGTLRFLRSPLEGPYQPPLKNAGDWLAVAGAVLFTVSVFAMKWISVGVDVDKIGGIPIIGPLLDLIPKSLTSKVQGGLAREEFRLFVSP